MPLFDINLEDFASEITAEQHSGMNLLKPLEEGRLDSLKSTGSTRRGSQVGAR